MFSTVFVFWKKIPQILPKWVQTLSTPPHLCRNPEAVELLECLVDPNMSHSNPQNQAQPLFQSCHSPLIVYIQLSCCDEDYFNGFRVDEKRSVLDRDEDRLTCPATVP